ncbi:hypothetical protein M0D21_01500 [Aquimarina sp. D1M17]|uniref:phage upper tail fiber protein n=1 Tax=Aquimarina acroporae TaxID=2937283 RepID=UPI0020BDBA46|nr:hypothetical protein [Aquimarina acroporae]MCK8520219.1 hypothetical protein [Aquimarina acroporae]
MAIHKFILKPGKGIRTISASDLELIHQDTSEDYFDLRNRIQNVNENVQNRLNRNVLINSDSLLTVFNQTTTNNVVSYKLGYGANDQNAEFRFNSVQGVLNTVKHLFINSDTNNTINFTAGQPAIQIIVPQGKLPSVTGKGKTVHAQTLRTAQSQNLVYLTGDLDEVSSGDIVNPITLEEGSPNPIAKVWSGTQSQYNAIATKKEDVLYFIVEEQAAAGR